MIRKYRNLILFLILALAFILRFWHYDVRYGIGYDGSRDAIVSFESARQLQLPLTGSFSSIGPVTFGPWYYYYLTLANFVIPSIWAPWIAIGLASFLMVFVMYKIGGLLIDPGFGLLLAFITAISPAQISAATSLQQHALIGLLSSLILYLFIKISLKTPRGWQADPELVEGEAMTPPMVKETGKLSIIWGFFSGVAVNTHFQALGLFTLPVILFFCTKRKRFILNFLVGLFISMIPILTFELNNHWFNTRNIIDYILIGQYRIWTSNRWLTFVGQFWPNFWSYVLGIPFALSLFIMVMSGFILLIRFIKKILPSPITLISVSFALQVILLRYYRGEKFFGYLQFFHPFLFIYTGYLMYLLFKKVNSAIIISLVIISYLVFVLPVSLSNLQPDKFNLETKQRFGLLTQKFPKEKFSTYECKKVYDTNRIQGLVLLLYMNKKYDDHGRKIAIYNPSCAYDKNQTFGSELVDVNNMSPKELVGSGLMPMTPLAIYSGTARWWFKEQP